MPTIGNARVTGENKRTMGKVRISWLEDQKGCGISEYVRYVDLDKIAERC
jgi:hypothetical protein